MLELLTGRCFGRACLGLASVWLGCFLSVGAWGQAVYVEDSPAALELAERAGLWREQGRLSEAVSALVELGETYPGKLMPVEPGRYVDATGWVRRALSEDDALRAVYEREAEPAAARELSAALASGAAAGGFASGEVWYDAEALAGVGRRHWSTPSGLRANLWWCALMLERGEWSSALAMLDGLGSHPGLSEAEASERYAALRGWAGAQRLALSAGLASAAEGMGAAGAEVSLEEPLWTVWWDDFEEVGRPAGTGLVEEPEGVPVVAGDFGVRWDLGLDNEFGPAVRVNRAGGRPNTMGTNRFGMRAGGVLSGDAVFVSDGLWLASVDRSSGRARWALGWPGLWEGSAARGQRLLDRRGVLVSGTSVWAVLGPSQATRARMGSVGEEQGVWCVDRATGATRWRVLVGELGEGFTGAQFMGVPVAAGPGVVAVRVRRVQASGFVDAFVVGLDAGSGAVLWTRHLASTADTGGMSTLPPAEPMVASGGRLFVDEGLGVVAALDPRDGGVYWLRKLVEQADEVADGEEGGGEVEDGLPGVLRQARAQRAMRSVQGRTGPAVLPAGVLVAGLSASSPDRLAWLLDPATGEVRRRLEADAEPWVARARWTVGEAVGLGSDGSESESESELESESGLVPLVVQGETLWLLDGRDLSVVWRGDRELGSAREATSAVVDGSRLLAVSEGVLFSMDLLEGLGGAVPVNWVVGASPLAGGGEVFRVSSQGVSGMVSADWGERRLRDRVARAAVGDAEPGLAMVTLGLGAGRPGLLLDGVRAALGAGEGALALGGVADGLSSAEVDALLAEFGDGERGGGVEREAGASALALSDEGGGVSVVLELIERIAGGEALARSVRREAFDLVASSVSGPSELVAYHLAMGPLEREAGRAEAAVGHFQAVLQDPLLARQVPRLEGARRSAGVEARRQLTSMIAEFGFGPYAKFDEQAQSALDALLLEAPRDAVRLEALADRFPLSLAACEALTLAGDVRSLSASPHQAYQAYKRAYRVARTSADRDRASGKLAELYIAQDRPQLARNLIQGVWRDFPSASPWMDGRPTARGVWESRLAGLPSAVRRLPMFDASTGLEAWSTPGMPVPVRVEARDSLRSDLAVLRHFGRLSVVDPRERRVLLDVPFTARDAEVVRFSDDQLVLASPQRGAFILIDVTRPDGDAQEVLIQPALDGQLRPLAEAEALGAEMEAALAGMDRAEQAEQRRLQLLRMQQGNRRGLRFFAANEALLLVADRSGRVAALDRFTGALQWSHAETGASFSGLFASDDAVVLIGLADAGTAEQEGLVVVLDPLTGERLGRPIREASNAPMHALPRPDGTVLVTYPTFVASYALPDQAELWTSPRPADVVTNFSPPPVTGTPGDGVLAMNFPSGVPTVLLLDPDTGQTNTRLLLGPSAGRVAGGAARVLAADGLVHVLSDVPECFDALGNRVWRSVVDEIGSQTIHQSLAEDHVLVLSRGTGVGAAVGGAVDLNRLAGRPVYRLDVYERRSGRLLRSEVVPSGRSQVSAGLARLYDHAFALPMGDQTVFLVDGP